jgi:hypothetical protein
MADLLRLGQVRELAGHGGGPCVSVFLPAHRMTPDSGQDPIRLRNLLDEAERQLVAGGLRAPVAREVVQPGRDLLGPGWFWSHQSDGLAVFLAPGWSRVFRLPQQFPELVVVAGRFHVKPLRRGVSASHPACRRACAGRMRGWPYPRLTHRGHLSFVGTRQRGEVCLCQTTEPMQAFWSRGLAPPPR